MVRQHVSWHTIEYDGKVSCEPLKPILLEHRTAEGYRFEMGETVLVPRDFDAIVMLPGVDYFAPGNRLQEKAAYLARGSGNVESVLENVDFAIVLGLAETIKRDPGKTRPKTITRLSPEEVEIKWNGSNYDASVVSPREIQLSEGNRVRVLHRDDSGNPMHIFWLMETVTREGAPVYRRLLAEYYNAWGG